MWWRLHRCLTHATVDMTYSFHRHALRRVVSKRHGGGSPVNNNGCYPPPNMSRLGTADLADILLGDVYDACGDNVGRRMGIRVQVLDPQPRFVDYGGAAEFSGRIATVQCF